MPQLRLHHFLPRSQANGPGVRAVLWVQGCSLGCPGCFNPQTHTFEAGELVETDVLIEKLVALEGDIEGVTISGGEPFQQRPALTALLKRLRRETSLSILIFSGFTWEEIQRFPEVDEVLGFVDVLIAGRYEESQRLAVSLIGSANKRVHFLTPRYTQADLEAVPEAEIVITPEGEILATGIDPLTW